ncbi:hypothetical protein MPTK1_3g04580 [Marchantia polymorpha subsp. ruderalis]|uniref:Peptidase A1 domain-containing protein n=2 Tax=Marchantia polymorpha TaxID=3197 RepID=A0AAF6AXF1_MARPO|nr:hypothetical protein MARPO_0022s0070 [Marchantia polymorpha]BBN04435.1 hypothetical protein Mp_3g04580 [Marchantia polymorpha subsp. ruderalis]|eukprot:PTQ43966.1 hypothetical protein MARPO_0022s0070 [Marchantia polymorpha]
MASSLVLCLVSLLMVTISTTTCTPQELNRDANSDPTDRPSGSPGRPETAEMSGGPWRSIQAELVHKDHPLRAAPGSLSFKERAERDFQSSRRRSEVLRSRHERWLAGGGGGLPTYVSNLSTNVNEAEYVMTISLGTPAQNFVAIADTGSDLTWLQCQPCAHCFPQADPLYDPSRSSSHANLTCADSACQRFTSQYPADWHSNCPVQSSSNASCNFFYAYGDGSNTTGDIAVDTIHLTSTDGAVADVPNFAFGCSQSTFSDSGLLSGNVDGLVGLGQGDISFPSQLGASFGNIFSYCLVPAKGVATQTSPLLFGSAALSNATGIQYTPILYNTSLYFVGLQAISVAGQPLGIPSSVFANNGTDGGTIFDSGTTYTQLQPQALDALGTALGGKMPFTQIPSTINGFDYCWDASGLTDADIAKHVPTVSFNFTGANYDLSFDNTFLTGGDALFRTICLAISRGVLVSESIIGNYQQRNVYVVYDRANSQIGFVPRNCGEAVSVSPSTTTGTSSASSSASAGTRFRAGLESVMTRVLLLQVLSVLYLYPL